MKALVAVKRVIDYQVKIRVRLDGSGIETESVKMSMNPFDEIAVEEAVRLKENKIVNEIIVVSIGSNLCQDVLRMALAMGADQGLLLETDQIFEPFNIAKILAAICCQEKPQLVLLGKQAIDDDCNQTGQMLAGFLDWAQGTFISKLECSGQQVIVTREIDGGLETIRLNLPAILTTDLRLNEPRYLSLPNIMKAKQKPLKIMPLAELNLDLHNHQELIRIDPPKERKPGIKVKNLQELMNKLKNEAGVLK
jgi:electron transfer flavoprotein beta subunit